MADFTPSAAEIQKFGELVKTGNRRYQEMVNSPVSLSPGERQQRTANFTAYYRTDRADGEVYEAAAVATKAEAVPSAIYINADDLGNRSRDQRHLAHRSELAAEHHDLLQELMPTSIAADHSTISGPPGAHRVGD
jgi:hypothetical protein